MKQEILEIQIPEGMEIDKEKSTFERIVFKQKFQKIVKNWEELEVIRGFYINKDSEILRPNIFNIYRTTYNNKHIIPHKHQAECILEYIQLLQLYERFKIDNNISDNGGYIISNFGSGPVIYFNQKKSFLQFDTLDQARLFKNTYFEQLCKVEAIF